MTFILGPGMSMLEAPAIMSLGSLGGIPKSIPGPTVAPRPPGVPDEWVAQPSKKGDGTAYINPNNAHERVRVMPGDPSSPNPAQRQPYVKWQKDGQFLDQNGNVVPGNSPEAHIPLNQFNKFK